jgi:undecaprenyl diphosphate synthase
VQRTFDNHARGIHLALLMDGNGRWGIRRGRSRSAGHRAGAHALRRIVEAAPNLGVSVLTVYAFSAANWKRPPAEVAVLMSLFRDYLEGERENCVRNGVRVSVIGRRDRLAPELRRAIAATEGATVAGTRLHLRIAVDYSSREAILAAARRIADLPDPQPQDLARWLAEYDPRAQPAPDVDVLVRTAGEHRLSDFLLWECAYAELFFTPTLWPDFEPKELEAILREFCARERRFGAISPAAAAR